ncbi:MAG: hypothetical protein ABIR80_10770, partial [Opitutaceae bacterium]
MAGLLFWCTGLVGLKAQPPSVAGPVATPWESPSWLGKARTEYATAVAELNDDVNVVRKIYGLSPHLLLTADQPGSTNGSAEVGILPGATVASFNGALREFYRTSFSRFFRDDGLAVDGVAAIGEDGPLADRLPRLAERNRALVDFGLGILRRHREAWRARREACFGALREAFQQQALAAEAASQAATVRRAYDLASESERDALWQARFNADLVSSARAEVAQIYANRFRRLSVYFEFLHRAGNLRGLIDPVAYPAGSERRAARYDALHERLEEARLRWAATAAAPGGNLLLELSSRTLADIQGRIGRLLPSSAIECGLSDADLAALEHDVDEAVAGAEQIGSRLVALQGSSANPNLLNEDGPAMSALQALGGRGLGGAVQGQRFAGVAVRASTEFVYRNGDSVDFEERRSTQLAAGMPFSLIPLPQMARAAPTEMTLEAGVAAVEWDGAQETEFILVSRAAEQVLAAPPRPPPIPGKAELPLTTIDATGPRSAIAGKWRVRYFDGAFGQYVQGEARVAGDGKSAVVTLRHPVSGEIFPLVCAEIRQEADGLYVLPLRGISPAVDARVRARADREPQWLDATPDGKVRRSVSPLGEAVRRVVMAEGAAFLTISVNGLHYEWPIVPLAPVPDEPLTLRLSLAPTSRWSGDVGGEGAGAFPEGSEVMRGEWELPVDPG